VLFGAVTAVIRLLPKIFSLFPDLLCFLTVHFGPSVVFGHHVCSVLLFVSSTMFKT